MRSILFQYEYFAPNEPNVIMDYGEREITDHSFEFCNRVISITVCETLIRIHPAPFAHCPNLASITVSERNPHFDSRDNCNAIIRKSKNILVAGCMNTVIPDSVKVIGEGAFENCTGLQTITIPDSVRKIDAHAFKNCSNLSSITFPKSMWSLGFGAFEGCTGLKSVFITSNIRELSYIRSQRNVFEECTGIESIIVDKRNKYFDSRNDCNAIIHTRSNTLLTGCKNTVIPNTVLSISDSAFYGCSGLTSIVIPDSVQSIGSSAFGLCDNLTTVVLPNSLQNVSHSAFWGRRNIKQIFVPKGKKDEYKRFFEKDLQDLLIEKD